jgi:hypothetical protein
LVFYESRTHIYKTTLVIHKIPIIGKAEHRYTKQPCEAQNINDVEIITQIYKTTLVKHKIPIIGKS